MIRTYGKTPYHVAVIHGGPGALGSLAHVARELSKTIGVVEPLQTRFCIADLITELKEQIGQACQKPVTLIGHSWGAWLSCLYSATHPQDIKQLVLIGCPPFDAIYSGKIMEQRKKRMTQGEWALFNGLLFRLDRVPQESRNWLLEQLTTLLEKTDHYERMEKTDDEPEDMHVNGNMYLSIWNEAEAMCENGQLLAKIKNIRCPIHIIHGDYDPHPVEGVIVPFQANNIPFLRYALSKCGHEPFREKHAHETFYNILKKIISPD